MKRRIYFQMMSLADAQGVLPGRFAPASLLSSQLVDAGHLAGRISAQAIFARSSSPGCHTAAMDGYALLAQDSFGASDDTPVLLSCPAQAKPVNTGHPLPDGTDAVVMIELVHEVPGGGIEIRQAVYPWQNVRKVGEDIVETELLFPSLHKFSPHDIGALLTGGITRAEVLEQAQVSIIPTGNELISAAQADRLQGTGVSGAGGGWRTIAVIDSNSSIIAALLAEAGCVPKICPIVPDEFQALKEAVLREVRSPAHVVIINAGSSSGSEDYTAGVIEELGELLVHGVTMMPGKPSAIGVIEGKPIFGTPGYPVSAVMSIEQLVLPFLCHIQAQALPERRQITARISKKIPSRSGLTEFRRLVVGKVGNGFVATPIKKGAGSITTLTKANALLTIPSHVEGIEAGAEVDVELLRHVDDVTRTLLCIGSHDLALDLIREFLRRGTPSFGMASGHVGSLGGVLAVRDRMAHLAGSHLLDPATGEYNVPTIKAYLPDIPVRLIHLAYRIQGLMVHRGNPKGIRAIEDIRREDITYINRQRGAGTRVLLDYTLQQQGIAPESIRGYDNEETTHLAVAASIQSGKADAGMGVLAAANALGLDFIPLLEERYDLIIPEEFLALPMVARLLDIIVSREFQGQLEQMGGYRLQDAGKELYHHCP